MLLSLLGGLIVFFTYAIREGLREHAKDESDSLSTAESVFLIRGSGGFVPYTLDMMDRQVKLQIKQLAEKGTTRNFTSGQSPLESVVDLLRAEIGLIDQGFDNCNRFQMKIEDVSVDISEKLSKVDGTLKSLHEEEGGISAVTAQLTLEGKQTVSEDFRNRLISLGAETNTIGKTMIEVSDSLLAQARDHERKYQTSLKILTWLSFMLYGLGWSLALAARLLGGDEAEQSE
jgi:hypothetical protein